MHVLYFGRHQGKPLGEIDLGYLQWALRECKLSSGLQAALTAEVERRGGTAPPTPPPSVAPTCRRCVMVGGGVRLSWLQQRNGTRAIRRTCDVCGASLGAASAPPENIALADKNALPAPALLALILAEEQGVRLQSDGAVADIVGEDFRKADPRLREALRQCRHLLGSMIGRTN